MSFSCASAVALSGVCACVCARGRAFRVYVFFLVGFLPLFFISSIFCYRVFLLFLSFPPRFLCFFLPGSRSRPSLPRRSLSCAHALSLSLTPPHHHRHPHRGICVLCRWHLIFRANPRGILIFPLILCCLTPHLCHVVCVYTVHVHWCHVVCVYTVHVHWCPFHFPTGVLPAGVLQHTHILSLSLSISLPLPPLPPSYERRPRSV